MVRLLVLAGGAVSVGLGYAIALGRTAARADAHAEVLFARYLAQHDIPHPVLLPPDTSLLARDITPLATLVTPIYHAA
jgi:hypothetical protein